MADFDADKIYYSHQNLQQQQQPGNNADAPTNNIDGRLVDEEERAVDSDALRRHYREFLSEFASSTIIFKCITHGIMSIYLIIYYFIAMLKLHYTSTQQNIHINNRKLSSGCQQIHLP